KIALLEDELDGAERNVKHTVDRLRQVDVTAQHFERQSHVHQERDQWAKKCELYAAQAKYREAKAELDELVAKMEGL
ncbi:hypothetical protein DFH08DRAFT_719950, partial [Mycena albidolilacea]